MSRDDMKLLLNNVLLACQLCLGLWQFCKLSPVGALIQGVIGWLVRPLGLSPVYSRLQPCEGRVFKRTNCFVLQADIPSDRTGSWRPEVNTMNLHYLGTDYLLERKGENSNMLFIDHKMCYYITHRIWEELQNLELVLRYGVEGTPLARVVLIDGASQPIAAEAQRFEAEAQRLEAEARTDPSWPLNDPLAEARIAAYAARAAASATRDAAEPTTAAVRAALADAVTARTTLFVKGKREFWKRVIAGGVMTFEEVSDEIILKNQHVSARLNNEWLLPVNMSASEEKILKIVNLIALFLQTKKKVHWPIPLSLSFISALLEFNIKLRVWLYTKINVLFCSIIHLICDPLPRSWRRQLYSMGMWVEDLTPSNDILVKVVRGNMCAIITEGAKVDKVGAISVPWLEMHLTPADGIIEKQFRCDAIDSDIRCKYVSQYYLCEISAPTISVFYVKCENGDVFRRIITLVSCIAQNGSGSLISYGPKNKVRVRGFEESVTSHVKGGLPTIYKLELGNVVVG